MRMQSYSLLYTTILLLAAAPAVIAVRLEDYRDRTLLALERALAFIVRVVAEPVEWLARPDKGNIFGLSALAYNGPDMDLRHEAGTWRRSADRNI